MTKGEFNAVFIEAVNRFRQLAPKKTGHLAFNAIKYRWVTDTHFQIYVDRNVIENIAPVLPSGKRGKPAKHYYPQTIDANPKYRTYRWIERTARQIAQYLASRLGGKVS